jgi:hypothetical protein
MAPTAADPIALVEAAYQWTADERAWLDAILATAAPYDVGGGVIACTATAHPTTTVRAIDASANTAAADVEQFHRVVAEFPPALARQVFAPAELVGSGGHRLGRIANSASGAEPGHRGRRASCRGWGWSAAPRRPRCDLLPHGRAGNSGRSLPHAGRRARRWRVRTRRSAAPAPARPRRAYADDAETEAVLSRAGAFCAGGAARRPARASRHSGAGGDPRGDARRADCFGGRRVDHAGTGRWTIQTVERDSGAGY